MLLTQHNGIAYGYFAPIPQGKLLSLQSHPGKIKTFGTNYSGFISVYLTFKSSNVGFSVALVGRVIQRICELLLSFVNICSVERYDPSKDSWEMVASMADKRIHFGVAVMLGFIFVVGGHNGVSHLSSIERYDPHQNQWTVCKPMKEPRTGNNLLDNIFIVMFLEYNNKEYYLFRKKHTFVVNLQDNEIRQNHVEFFTVVLIC